MNLPHIYIAGPYTHASRRQRVENKERAMDLAEEVLFHGGFPIVPHLQGIYLEHVEGNYEIWQKATMRQMHQCDAVVFMHTFRDSPGSLEELKQAKCPVFFATAVNTLPEGFHKFVEEYVAKHN